MTVLAVAALLFGSLVVTQTVSAGSPITLSSDKTSATVLENENVLFTLTLANAGTDFASIVEGLAKAAAGGALSDITK